MIEIREGLQISEDELTFTATRSSGPGGQNVNKVNTRITLFFDVENCPALTPGQKRTILAKLKTRADKHGVIHVVSQRHRTQIANREAAIERLVELLQGALKRKPVRKKTRVPYSSKLKRLDDKKQRGSIKKLRSQKDFSKE
jgi:ribosome-associated protein